MLFDVCDCQRNGRNLFRIVPAAAAFAPAFGTLEMRFVAVVLAVCVAYFAQQLLKQKFKVTIQDHLLHHTYSFHKELLSNDTGNELHELLLSVGSRASGGFSSNVNDNLRIKHEHIGEVEPIEADGSCKEKFLVPNSAKTACILPGRVDIGRHYGTCRIGTTRARRIYWNTTEAALRHKNQL